MSSISKKNKVCKSGVMLDFKLHDPSNENAVCDECGNVGLFLIMMLVFSILKDVNRLELRSLMIVQSSYSLGDSGMHKALDGRISSLLVNFCDAVLEVAFRKIYVFYERSSGKDYNWPHSFKTKRRPIMTNSDRAPKTIVVPSAESQIRHIKESPSHLEQVRWNPTIQFRQDDSATDPGNCMNFISTERVRWFRSSRNSLPSKESFVWIKQAPSALMAESVAFSASFAQCNVGMRHSFKIMASTTTKYRCTATLSQPYQYHATPYNIREQSTSILADMFTKALPEDQFKYLVRRIGMRCLTPADLDVLTNETA
ncbi:hypothetical protein Tco_0318110 [Tanacetum coccineum]